MTVSRTHLVVLPSAPLTDVRATGGEGSPYGPDEGDRGQVRTPSRTAGGSTPVVWAALLVGLLGLGALLGA